MHTFFLTRKKLALSEHIYVTNHLCTVRLREKIPELLPPIHVTIKGVRCLEAWHINIAHTPLNRNDGDLLPDAYMHLVNR